MERPSKRQKGTAVGRAVVKSGAMQAEVVITDLGTARGLCNIRTGVCFLDHMIDQLTAHAQLGLCVTVSRGGVPAEAEKNATDASDASCGKQASGTLGCVPDDEVLFDMVGEAVGKALKEILTFTAAGGTSTAARFMAPLDEALTEAIIDPGNGTTDGSLVFALAPYGDIPKGVGRTWIGKYRTVLTETFFASLVRGSGIKLSLRKIRGGNAHHIVEATFKSFARALRVAFDELSCFKPTESDALGLAMARGAKRERKTRETSMEVSVALDGRAIADIDTGIAFLDSMLAEIVAGSRISMVVKVRGDLWIDDHHTAEDSMITLGQVLNEALGDRGGCCRMGCASAEHPQSNKLAGEKASVTVVMDLSNRPILVNGLEGHFRDGAELCDDLATEMVDHVFLSLTMNAQSTVHIIVDEGSETKALTLAACRAYGEALRNCTTIDPRRAGAAASSKGTLSV